MPDVLNRRGEFKPDPEPLIDFDTGRPMTFRQAEDAVYGTGHNDFDYVGVFKSNRQCTTCRAILMPDKKLGGWADDAAMRFWAALDAAEDPETVPDPKLYHWLPFVPEPAEEDEEAGSESVILTPEVRRTCGVEGCTNWAHECELHETATKVEYRKAQRAAWRSERGLNAPRETMPSRIDRSAEYAKANAKRRAERAAAR